MVLDARVRPERELAHAAREFESEIHDPRNAMRVLSCVVGYALEKPQGSTVRSDHNLDVETFAVDPAALLTATEGVAELADDLFEKVSVWSAYD